LLSSPPNFDKAGRRLIQVAAVAVAAVEFLDRNDLSSSEITRGLIPARRAIFDIKTCGLEMVETDDGKQFFANETKFFTLQREAILIRCQKLKTQYAWVEAIEDIFFPDHQYLPKRNPEDPHSGALIQFDFTTGEVVEHLGLYKKTTAVEVEEADQFESQYAEGQAKYEALISLVTGICSRLEASPFYALRLLCFLAVKVKDEKDIAKVWQALIGADDETILLSLAASVAERFKYELPHRLSGDRLHPVIQTLAKIYHLPIPEILLTSDQQQEAAQ
jgi:hypothetical protein